MIQESGRRLPFADALKVDPKTALQTRYQEEVYPIFRDDSPDASRVALADAANPIIRSLGNAATVLDIGGGPQTFAWTYFQKYGQFDPELVTVDNVPFKPEQLLLGAFRNVRQVVADADALPIPDASVALGVSNLALDFAMAVSKNQNGPLAELHRVLEPGAPLLVNLHHPKMFPEDLEAERNKRAGQQTALDTIAFWEFFQESGLFTSPYAIRERFAENGFQVQEVTEQTDGTDWWWNVSAEKPI